MSARELITEHLDLWIGAVTKKSSSGRGSNGKSELTGVKKLRELILQLAVEGKLVHQDSSHKPASELLQAAADEKAQALKVKKIRKSQLGDPASVISESDVPEGWAITTLSAIGYWAIGNGFPKAHQGETGLEVLFCKVSDMNLSENSREIHTTVNSVSEQTANSLKLNIHSSGTVIFPKIGGAISTNKRRVIIKPTAIDNNCLGITPTCAISSGYLYLFLTSVDMTQYQVGTSVPALSQGTLGKIPIKLPPLEEQHRIVQKVDELMALCDRLEQQTSDQLEAHETLVDTLRGTLTQSENATELADNWARLAANFDALFTTEQSIDKLKQTILQLAVMGLLVVQDAGDEPTDSLLKKIDQEIASLLKQGRIKTPKSTPEILDDDKFFEIPDAWRWVRLGSLALHSEAGWSPKCHDAPRENQSWAVLKVSAVTWGEFRPGENKELPANLTPKPEYEVHPSDFLISRANTSDLVARSVVVPEAAPSKLMMSDKIIRFVFSKQVEPLYLNLFNNSPFARNYYLSVAGGTSSSMKNVSRTQIQSLAVPLPPKAEQTRIVQKVDELMALCDQLKERLNQANETQCLLAAAVVENALE